jgi:hypothetical protein
MHHHITFTETERRATITREHALTEHLNHHSPFKAHTDASPMRDEVTQC